MTESFRDKLTARIKEVDSLLCIGLDPHQSELYPSTDAWNQASNEDKAAAAFTFCKTLIDATLSTAVCYKPNAAFFEAMGAPGIDALHRVIREIPPTIPVLLDAKRGDIGSTASAYAEAAYQQAQASAVTLSPLMGWDSVAPFVEGTSHRGVSVCDGEPYFTWPSRMTQAPMPTRAPFCSAKHPIPAVRTFWPCHWPMAALSMNTLPV